jgi:RNA polymerase sigma factor (sigma-70 family)
MPSRAIGFKPIAYTDSATRACPQVYASVRLPFRARNFPVDTVSLVPEAQRTRQKRAIGPTVEVSALKPTALAGPRGSGALLRLQSDERLIALTRRGQQAAFEALFSRYHARLLSFCRHMLASREDAEDVLQEVFVAAFNAILADEREINVRPWLYRIARNRSLNHLRRASAIGVDSMDIHFADHGLSTGEKVLRRESFRQLIADVQQLPETQRTALLLREIDALSYEQIALAMETTVPSVKSLLVRARISLAEAAEARLLSCDEVRQQLGEAAEGLLKIEAPARRHLRDCESCRAFRKHLKDNNHALAAILPVGPLLLLKKLLLTKFGSASAGGAHVAGAGGATAGVSAAGAGAGAAGGMSVGGLATAGAGALATKAAATLAAAALVAGAVEVDHSGAHHRHHSSRPASTYVASSAGAAAYSAPAVARSTPQPASTLAHFAAAHHARRHALRHAPAAVSAARTVAATVRPPAAPATVPLKPPVAPPPPMTQVTSETTSLPSSTATTTAPPTATVETPQPATPPTTTTTTTTTTESTTSATPPPVAAPPEAGEEGTDATGGTPSPPADAPPPVAIGAQVSPSATANGVE